MSKRKHRRGKGKWASWVKATSAPDATGKVKGVVGQAGAVVKQWAGYGGAVFTSCDHWRDEVKVGEFTVLASSHRWVNKNSASLLTPPVPDTGIYLYSGWADTLSNFMACGMATPTKGPWPFMVVRWPDMGLMSGEDEWKLLKVVEKLIRKGDKVEIACMGGHGRTGTLLAMLKVTIGGMGAKAAIEELREEYCEKTVESVKQIDAIYKLAGEEVPKEAEVKPSKSWGGGASTVYATKYCADCTHSQYMHKKVLVGDKAEGCNAKTWVNGNVQNECVCKEWIEREEDKDKEQDQEAFRAALDDEGAGASVLKPANRPYSDVQQDKCICTHPRSSHIIGVADGTANIADGNDFCVRCGCDNFELHTRVTATQPIGAVRKGGR